MGALELLGESPEPNANALSVLGDVSHGTLPPQPVNPLEMLLNQPTTVTPFGVVSPGQILGQLPQAGMMAGGALGGPVGAGLGGGVGEAARQGLTSALTASPQFNPEELDKAVALGAVSELGGLAASKALGWTGKKLMQVAAKTSPEVAEMALNEGIALSQKGLNKLMNRIGQVGAETRGQVVRLTRRGVKVDPMQMATDVLKEFENLFQGGQAIVSADKKKILQMTTDFLNDHPGKISPQTLYKIKQTSDRIARKIHEAVDNFQAVPQVEQLEGRWHKAMADWARSRLHLDPTIAAKDALADRLIALKNAVWPAVRRQETMGARVGAQLAQRGTGAAVGALAGSQAPGDRRMNALIGAGAGAALGNPAVLSKVALAANSPLWQVLFTQAPREATTVKRGAEVGTP